jgi:hypothetical protein
LGVVVSVIGLTCWPGIAVGAAASSFAWHPAPRTTWQWQLSGSVDTSVEAQVYDVDLFDTPRETIDLLHVQGRRVVCYFSAGSFEVRRPDAASFPRRALGKSLDSPFASERWLDIRNGKLRPIMTDRLDLARFKQCDGVEPDNVDGFENKTGFRLSRRQQLAYNRFIAEAARDRGLAVGLKNNAKQAAALEPSFDFAVVEQCFEFDECAKYVPFVDHGKAVFEAEYNGDPTKFCPAALQLRFSAILKRLDVGASRVACPTGG